MTTDQVSANHEVGPQIKHASRGRELSEKRKAAKECTAISWNYGCSPTRLILLSTVDGFPGCGTKRGSQMTRQVKSRQLPRAKGQANHAGHRTRIDHYAAPLRRKLGRREAPYRSTTWQFPWPAYGLSQDILDGQPVGGGRLVGDHRLVMAYLVGGVTVHSSGQSNLARNRAGFTSQSTWQISRWGSIPESD